MLTIFGAACGIIGVMSVAGLERSGDSPASSNVALAFAGVFSLPLFAIGQLFIVIGFWTAVNSLAVEASAAGLRSTRRCFGIAVARRSMAHTDIAAIESRMAARYIGAFGRSRYYRLIASGRDPTHRSMLIADTLKGIEMTSEVRRIIVDRLAITGLDAAGRQDLDRRGVVVGAGAEVDGGVDGRGSDCASRVYGKGGGRRPLIMW